MKLTKSRLKQLIREEVREMSRESVSKMTAEDIEEMSYKDFRAFVPKLTAETIEAMSDEAFRAFSTNLYYKDMGGYHLNGFKAENAFIQRRLKLSMKPEDIYAMSDEDFTALSKEIDPDYLPIEIARRDTSKAFYDRLERRAQDEKKRRAQDEKKKNPSPAEKEEKYMSPLARHNKEVTRKWREKWGVEEVKRIVREEIKKEIRKSKLR